MGKIYLKEDIDLNEFREGYLKLIQAVQNSLKIILLSISEDTETLFRVVQNSLSQLYTFDKLDNSFKNTCKIILDNGFYPSEELSIAIKSIEKIKNKKQIIDLISQEIEDVIISEKKQIINFFSNRNKIITQIYDLYYKKEYRLCILSLINIISIESNNYFVNKDFNEYREIKGILTNMNMMLENNESNYMKFAPFLIENPEANKLITNYRNEPQKYKKYPYNRNAIVHGYSTRFGTKRNCLRWFSVLLNTMGIIKDLKLLKMESSLGG